MSPKASLFRLEDFQEIERKLEFAYPRSFFLHLSELAAASAGPRFAGKARLLTSAADVQAAYENLLPGEYVPFLADEQHNFTDYYSFNTNSSGPEFEVVVFARDAVVASWNNFESFIAWAGSPSHT